MNILIGMMYIKKDTDEYLLYGTGDCLVSNIKLQDDDNSYCSVLDSLIGEVFPCTCIYSHDYSGEFTVRARNVEMTIDGDYILVNVGNSR